MNFNSIDETAIAQAGLNHYVQQASLIAPEIRPLVPAQIKVERIGFTRNASNTPYLVYTVDGRRCCSFIKRSRFLELVQMLLKLKYSIEDRIQSMVSSPEFGISVKLGEYVKYIPRVFLNKFFERYNQIGLEKTEPCEQCSCNDLYDMCLHAIAVLFQPKLIT